MACSDHRSAGDLANTLNIPTASSCDCWVIVIVNSTSRIILVKMALINRPDIPLVYRFLFLYFEPAGALLGSLLMHFHPQPFLTTMAPALTYMESHQVVYDVLAATYVLFAFNEAVVLRMTDDLTIWKTMLLGILLCDAIHLYGSWSALGSDVFWNPLNWRWEDAVNLGSLWIQGALRVAFIREVGFSTRVSKPKHA